MWITGRRKQLETIRTRTFDNVAREISHNGIVLTYGECDALGEECVAWLVERLSLVKFPGTELVMFVPARDLDSPMAEARP